MNLGFFTTYFVPKSYLKVKTMRNQILIFWNLKLCIVIFSTARATWVLNNIFIIEKSTNFVVRSRKLHNFYFLLFARRKKNEAKPNGICHHHFTSDNKIIRTYTQIVHNMLDFTLLTYTKGLGVMLTENCEKSYFHERYQNLSKHLIDQIHQLISKFVFRRPVDHGTLKVEIVFFLNALV